MHRTETIDYGIVPFGEIVFILDDTELTVKAGDVIVQCGTIHAWTNRSGQTCRLAFVLIDGKYEERFPRYDSGVICGDRMRRFGLGPRM